MHAKRKNTPPFLTTVHRLSNDERMWRYHRRKADYDYMRSTELRYLGGWVIAMAVVASVVIFGQFFTPCVYVWTEAGIHCVGDIK